MNYHTIAVSVPGRRHIREGIPCQDASLSTITPRPLAIVCDGRGSAPLSHFGATAAVEALHELTNVLQPILAELLDSEQLPTPEKADWLGDVYYRGAAIVQQRLALAHGRTPEEYQFTLLIAVGGKERFFLMQIGDGGIVLNTPEAYGMVFQPHRGEYANVTEFVRFGAEPQNMQNQFVETHKVQALALFSDGTADRMVKNNTLQPATGFYTIWQKVADGHFGNRELRRFLTESSWEPAVLDDRSLAILVTAPSAVASTSAILKANQLPWKLSPLPPAPSRSQAATKKSYLLPLLLLLVLLQTLFTLVSFLQRTGYVN